MVDKSGDNVLDEEVLDISCLPCLVLPGLLLPPMPPPIISGRLSPSSKLRIYGHKFFPYL